MKKQCFLFVVLPVLAMTIYTTVAAFDQPVMYRAPFFNMSPTEVLEPWATTISARVATGSTRKAFNGSGDTSSLFDAYGPFKLAQLGLGLTPSANRPVTSTYWGTGIPPVAPVISNGTFGYNTPTGGTPFTPVTADPTAGNANFYGRFRVNECDITLYQNLVWGLYFHAYLPLKDYKIDSITAQNVGPANVLGANGAMVNMANFISNDLPVILKENGLAPFDQTFKKSGIGDAVVSLGWQGASGDLDGIVTHLSGLMQMGASLPTAPIRDENVIFSIPLGYNGHWGVNSRLAGEIEFWDIFSLGVQAGSIIFFAQDRDMRMQTDMNLMQNGWIALQKGHTNVDHGAIWDLGAYAKVSRFVDGLAVILGYSFASQEETTLNVHDATFMQALIAQQAALVGIVAPGVESPNYVSQNAVVNHDQRLRGWQAHTIHCVVQYQPVMRLSPLIKAEYSCPIAGKRNWKTEMFAGTVGLSVDWGF